MACIQDNGTIAWTHSTPTKPGEPPQTNEVIFPSSSSSSSAPSGLIFCYLALLNVSFALQVGHPKYVILV